MRILGINSGNKGSSWNIACDILENAKMSGHEVLMCTQFEPQTKPKIDVKTFGNKCFSKINSLLTKIDGKDGFKNSSETSKLINIIKGFSPDLIHIHTVHGHCLNIQKLLKFTSDKKIPVLVTMHDSWWFTGRCSHVISNNCDLYKAGCEKCKFKNIYPKTLIFDRACSCSKKKVSLYEANKICFIGVSNWIMNCAKESYCLSKQRVNCIYNGLLKNREIDDLDITFNDGRKTILAVASPWSTEKGLDFIHYIDSKLDYTKFRLIVVGLKEGILSKNAETISTYLNIKQLNYLYKNVDVFINPSKQETLSSVNIEAQINGTPVIAFNTSGIPETVYNKDNLVDAYNFEEFFNKTLNVACSKKQEIPCEFINKFSHEKFIQDYLNVYEEWGRK